MRAEKDRKTRIQEAVEDMRSLGEDDTYVYISRPKGGEYAFASCQGTMNMQFWLMAAMIRNIIDWATETDFERDLALDKVIDLIRCGNDEATDA